jgi:hypothetical protein
MKSRPPKDKPAVGRAATEAPTVGANTLSTATVRGPLLPSRWPLGLAASKLGDTCQDGHEACGEGRNNEVGWPDE